MHIRKKWVYKFSIFIPLHNYNINISLEFYQKVSCEFLLIIIFYIYQYLYDDKIWQAYVWKYFVANF